MKGNWIFSTFFLAISLIFVFMLSGCGGGGGGGSSGGSAGNAGGTISLAWDAPATNADGSPLTDLAGFRIYYGTSSGVYTQSVDVGNVTTYTLTRLNKGQTYFVAATTYDTSNIESGLSNEVSAVAE